MANFRDNRHIGSSGTTGNLNDGTMVRNNSPRPGPVGASELEDFTLTEIVRRLRRAANGIELHQIAVHVLGNQCFSVGVIAGIGLDIISSAADLLKLAYTFVLADMHDMTKGKSYVRAGGVTASIVAYFFADELREAAEERDALIKELSEAFSDPKEMFENIADGVAESYKQDWRDYESHMAANSLEGRYRAGVIFGKLLISVLGLLTGIGGLVKGVGKAATKLPKLLKHAKNTKIPIIKTRQSTFNSGRSSKKSNSQEQHAPRRRNTSKESPSQRKQAASERQTGNQRPIKYGERGRYTEPGAVPKTDKLEREMKAAQQREKLPPPKKSGWPAIHSDEAATFRNTPIADELPEGTKLYRVVDKKSHPNGSYWTKTDPRSMTEAQWRSSSAVKGEWNGDGAFVEYEVPEGGMKVWQGETAAQMSSDGRNVLSGGGNQIWVPKGSTKAGAPKSTGY